MNSVSSNRVVIFSKSADGNSVKTRLRPLLNSPQRLDLHLALLKDTLQKASSFSTVLYLSDALQLPFVPEVTVITQHGPDLGTRLINAFAREFEQYSRVIIIGTDSPTFPPELISTAFLALDQHEIVIGPSEDGGYYLIGLSKMIPEIFQEIPWGTSAVFNTTLTKMKGHRYAVLEPYFDVDLPADLIRLQEELKNLDASYLRHTRDWFKNWGS